MPVDALINVFGLAVFLALAYFGYRALSAIGGEPRPDLPPEGGRISTVSLKTFTKGKSEHSVGNRQNGGFIELTVSGMRTGSLVVLDAAYSNIEAVTAKPFGLTKVVKFDFRDREQSLAATVRKRMVPALLNYLRKQSVPVSEP